MKIKCEVCNEEHKNKRFCSRSCYYQYKRDNKHFNQWKKGQKKPIGSFGKGDTHTEKTKEKLRISHLGKKFSIETRKKMSETHKNRKHWQNRPKGKDSPRWKGGYERKLFLNRKRRVAKLQADGSHTLGEWETLKAQYNWTCPSCKKQELKITLTEDHVIPLSKGGSDNIENIQPLCRSCNSAKHTKIIRYAKD